MPALFWLALADITGNLAPGHRLEHWFERRAHLTGSWP